MGVRPERGAAVPAALLVMLVAALPGLAGCPGNGGAKDPGAAADEAGSDGDAAAQPDDATMPGDRGGEGGGDAADAPSDAAPDAAADPGGGDVPDAAGVDAFACDSFVNIDFPCDREFRCTDATHHVPLHTVSCQEAGYDPRCCGGGGCEERPEAACGEGFLCIDGAAQPCTPGECGRPGDPPCPGMGTFCRTPLGQCDGPLGGLCTAAADCGQAAGWGATAGWVCGCDGRSYDSDLAACEAGTSRDHVLPCCDPGKMDFDQGNGAGRTSWVACVAGDMTTGLYDIQQVAFAICTGQPGEVASLGCEAGEWACRGDLYLDPGTTRVQDDLWARVCGVTSLPGVRVVKGLGGPDDCGTVGCAEAPLCGEPCAAPCGCCACTSGAFRCDSQDKALPIAYEQCIYGCWQPIQTPCPLGQSCRTAASGEAPCEASCDAVAFWWESLTHDSCTKDGDCEVISGPCGVGLGDCWEVVNGYVKSQGDIDALVQAWTGLSCSGPVCRCVAPGPGAACVDGTCQMVY
jgi:hypothetical protein